MKEYKNAPSEQNSGGEFGYIDSIYSGSGVDGKGLRVVVFFSGCNLRCPFCHNPETLFGQGTRTGVSALVQKILRYKPYLKRGGVTLSGGEPFLQKDFAIAVIRALAEHGVPVCIETNGQIADAELIAAAEYIICDVKNQENADLSAYDAFLSVCDALGARVELTNVLVPSKNDSEAALFALQKLYRSHRVSEGIRFLPFRKLCLEKYEKMKMQFPYFDVNEAEEEDILHAEKYFSGI